MKRLKLSTGTTGITRHPVSKPAWGEGVPEGNMYLAFAYFPFHHLALHAKKKVESVIFISLLVSFALFSHER